MKIVIEWEVVIYLKLEFVDHFYLHPIFMHVSDKQKQWLKPVYSFVTFG